MNRVAKKSTGQFKTKIKENSSFCANCCQLLHENEIIFRASPQVPIKTALHIIYNLDYNKHHFTQEEPEVVVLCGKCHLIFVNLFNFYDQFNGLRKVTSYLHKQIQHLDSLLQQIEFPNNHPIKSQDDDDDPSGAKNVNWDIDDADVKMEISSTEEVNSDSDEDYLPSDQDDLTCNDVTYSPAVESEDDTSRYSDSDDPLKIEKDEVTREQESTSTINSCHGSESDLSSSTQSDLTKHFVRVEQAMEVQNNTAIDLVTPQEEHAVTQPSKKDLDCKKCFKRFRSIEKSQIHQEYCDESKDDLSTLDTNVYPCTVPGCNKILNGSRRLKAHQKAAHFVFSEDQVTCTICQTSFKLRSHWSQHVRIHEESRSKCPKCSRNFTKDEYQIHIEGCRRKKKNFVREDEKEKKVRNNTLIDPVTPQKEHDVTQPSKKDLDCKKCFKRFRSIKKSQIHQKYCKVSKDDLFALDTKVYPCTVPGCNKILNGSRRLKAHQKATHFVFSEDQVTCTICQTSFKLRSHWSQHVRIHEENRSKCSKCSRNFTDDEYQTHIKGCTGKKIYSCDICGRNNFVYSAFKSHMAEHTGEYFKCPMPNCDKKFTTKYFLQYHVQGHDPSNQFKCPDPICGRIFKEKRGFTKHVLVTHPHLVSETEVENELCPVCGVTILGSNRLKIHMEIHREATFQCHVCPKAFKVKSLLDLHLARHEGKRTVPCTFEGCSKLFYRKHEVRNHMKTHTGEKNYLCPICGRASSDTGNLRKHMLIHSEVKQFKCHLCVKAYKQPQMLKTHLKTHQN